MIVVSTECKSSCSVPFFICQTSSCSCLSLFSRVCRLQANKATAKRNICCKHLHRKCKHHHTIKITNKEIVNLIDTVTKCKRFVSKVQIEYIVIAETRMLVSAEFGKQKRPNSQFWRRWKYIKSAKLQQQLHCRKSFCLSRISSCQSCFCSGKKSLLMKRNIWRVR